MNEDNSIPELEIHRLQLEQERRLLDIESDEFEREQKQIQKYRQLFGDTDFDQIIRCYTAHEDRVGPLLDALDFIVLGYSLAVKDYPTNPDKNQKIIDYIQHTKRTGLFTIICKNPAFHGLLTEPKVKEHLKSWLDYLENEL